MQSRKRIDAVKKRKDFFCSVSGASNLSLKIMRIKEQKIVRFASQNNKHPQATKE